MINGGNHFLRTSFRRTNGSSRSVNCVSLPLRERTITWTIPNLAKTRIAPRWKRATPCRLFVVRKLTAPLDLVESCDFFFEHGDPDAADEFGNQVEHDGANHPGCGAEQCGQQPEDGEVGKERAAIERERLPAE